MDRATARIIVKHTIQSTFGYMFREGIEIETEEELDKRLDELTDKVLDKEYEIKFKNLDY